MRKFFFQLLLLTVFFGCSQKEQKKTSYHIGLCIVATGAYDRFANELITSARNYFCKNHKVTYFVFSDGAIEPADDVVVIPQKRLGWPFDTLKRFHLYVEQEKLFSQMDYLFAIDADMRFVAEIGEEVLGKLVGVGRDVGKHITYERNKRSKANVSKKKGRHYFAGAFYGGEREEFLKLVRKAKWQVDADLKDNYIAVWHDESHLNRYFYDHEPAIILSTAYCYPECWDLPYEKKLVALAKDHAEIRK